MMWRRASRASRGSTGRRADRGPSSPQEHAGKPCVGRSEADRRVLDDLQHDGQQSECQPGHPGEPERGLRAAAQAPSPDDDDGRARDDGCGDQGAQRHRGVHVLRMPHSVVVERTEVEEAKRNARKKNTVALDQRWAPTRSARAITSGGSRSTTE